MVETSGTAAILSFALLLVGLAVAWVAGRYIRKVEGGTILALLFIPFLAYLIVSGQLDSFKGAGFEWKIRQAGAASAARAKPLKEFSSTAVAERAAHAEDLTPQAIFAEPVDVVLVRARAWSQLEAAQAVGPAIQVGTVIYSSLLAGSFVGLVVLDENDRPLGLFEASYFQDLLRVPFLPYRTLDADRTYAMSEEHVRAMIQQTELWVLLRAPEVRAEREGVKAFLSGETSQLAALDQMVARRWEAAIITDARGRHSGTLSRRQLFENLMLGAIRQFD